jgi:hypothetical protein
VKTAVIIGIGAVAVYALWKMGQPTAAAATLAGASMTGSGQANTVYGAAAAGSGQGLAAAPPPSHTPPIPHPITGPVGGNWAALRASALAAQFRPNAVAPAPLFGFSTPTVFTVRGTSPAGPIT